MATNLEIINTALREINVIAETQDASAEQGTTCLQKLNEMLEMWREVDIDFGWYEQGTTTDEAPIPLYAQAGVWSNLAVLCASQYGKTVSAELATVADRTYRFLQSKFQREKLKGVDLSNLPEGSGHTGSKTYNINLDR